LYETGCQGESPALDRLIANLESEFDLLRLERRVADLEERGERLLEEIDALRSRARIQTSSREHSEEISLMRRWWGALLTKGRIGWLRARRGMLAEERRRCMAIVEDIRFGMRLTGMRSSLRQ
jgi:hypothetical protein